MEAGDAIKHLSAARVSIALSAAALRVGTTGSPYLRVLHNHVISTRIGKYPTFAQLLASYSEIGFRFDVSKGPKDSGPNTVGYHLKQCTSVADVLRIILRATLKHTHALTSVFEIITPTKIFDGVQHNSPVHLYLRKIGMAFQCLSFDMLVHLRNNLVTYVKAKDGVPINTDTPIPYPFPVAILKDSVKQLSILDSTQNFNMLNKFHFAALDDNSRHHNNNSNNSSHHSTFAHVEYALHLEHIRRRDSSIASELLHRAFDLSLGIPPVPITMTRNATSKKLDRVRTDALFLPRRFRTETVSPEELTAAANANGNTANGNSNILRQERPQYAALALAALQAHAGEFAAASRALDDSVRLSQHNNDEICQARALKWLVRTTRSLTRRRELLKRMDDSIASAEEEIHSPKPQPNNDRYRNITGIMQKTGISRGDMRPNSLLLSAKAWYTYASLPTALSLARISLRVSHRNASSDGILTLHQTRAVCALAELTAEAETPTKALQLLDLHLCGKFEPVVSEEFSATQSSVFPQRDLLRKSRCLIAFNRALRKRHLYSAKKHLQTLAAYANCPAAAQGIPVVYTEAKLEYLEAQARLAIAEEDYFLAYKKSHQLRKAAAAAELPGRCIRGSIIGARAYILSGAEGCASVPLATGAVSLSESRGLIALNITARVVLAEAIFTVEKNTAEALRILTKVLPAAVGGLGKYTQAYTRRVYAQLLLAKWEEDSKNDTEDLKTAVVQLEEARSTYTEAEDLEGVRDCAYLLAKAYNETGNTEMRNMAAQMYSVAFETQLKREQSCDELLS